MIEFISSAPFVLSAVIVIAVAIAILLEFEKNGWATTLFSLGTALALWSYKSEVWGFVSSNPGSTIGFVLSYIVVGVIWSLIKWRSYVGTKANSFNLIKEEFIKEYGEIKSNWKQWIEYLNSISNVFYESWSPEKIVSTIVPLALSKKALIVSWISYWPISFCATLLNNPFRRFFEWVYSIVSGIYEKMSHSASKKMLVGFEKEVKKKVING